jgi:outer membrane protein
MPERNAGEGDKGIMKKGDRSSFNASIHKEAAAMSRKKLSRLGRFTVLLLFLLSFSGGLGIVVPSALYGGSGVPELPQSQDVTSPVLADRPAPVSSPADRKSAAEETPSGAGTEKPVSAKLYLVEGPENARDFQKSMEIEDGRWKLSLRQCLDTTLKRNLDIIVKGYQTEIAEVAINGARGIFDPQFQPGWSMSRQTSPTSSSLGGGTVVTNERISWDFNWNQNLQTGTGYTIGFQNTRYSTNNSFSTFNPYYTSQLTFGITQPLLKGWGVKTNTKDILIAKNSWKMSDEDFQLEIMNNVSQAIDAYWDLVFQIENLNVQKESQTLAKDFFEIEKARVEVGIKAPLDLAQAEAEVASREEAVITAESTVQDAEDRLKLLMNVPRSSELWNYRIIPVDQPSKEEKPVTVEEYGRKALENRPEIRSARYGLKNDEIRLHYSRNQLLPALNFSAGYGMQGLGGTFLERESIEGPIISTIPGGYADALRQVFSADYRSWSLGVDLVVPIRNRAAEAQHVTDRLNLQKDSDSLKNLEESVFQEVRQAVRNIETDNKRVRVARIARELQEKKLDAQQKKYEHGLSTTYEVLQFQTDLTRSRSEEIRAITDLNRALAALERSAGTILETYGIQYVRQ